ncbi:maternal effect embryo arrest 59 [Artemisia annua]|uniref:Maternal effect embryo arrest 59 n=1 Tax=Artemisia annua TaxID=35608 RepID=A0A2U1M4C6_ARTAN|nr:maternal effect embryo arrest 59 [Artemisia annua]
MVGQPSLTVKPSRSDEIIHPDQQLLISEQVRSYFESVLPKRPAKPNRSDPDSYVSTEPVDATIPELVKFQSLVSQSQGIVSDHKATAEEEFVETEYYKELVSIDKEHHTTGNGFIKVAREDNGNNSSYDIRLHTGTNGVYKNRVVKSNPATNDWVPSSGDYYDQDKYMSLKPNRSENW